MNSSVFVVLRDFQMEDTVDDTLQSGQSTTTVLSARSISSAKYRPCRHNDSIGYGKNDRHGHKIGIYGCATGCGDRLVSTPHVHSFHLSFLEEHCPRPKGFLHCC